MKCEQCGTDYPSLYHFEAERICKECYDKQGTNASNHISASNVTIPAEEVNPGLAGIAGWLIFPAIGLVLGPILLLIGLAMVFSIFGDMTDSHYTGYLTISILVQICLLVYMLIAAVRFFGKKKSAPGTIIGLMVASILASILLLTIALSSEVELFAAEEMKDLIRAIFAAVVWIPYFKVSKRVKATFIND